MSISLNVPTTRVPGVYAAFDSSKALQGLPGMPHKILLLGQRLAAGTVAEAVPTLITRVDAARAAFGAKSMLARMAAALKAVNSVTEVWAIALDDNPAGAAAAGSITVDTVATANGTLYLYIGGQRLTVGIASTMTTIQIAAAIVAAITAETSLPVTAAVNGVDDTKVDLTAAHKGLSGNDIDVRFNFYEGEVFPAGLTATIVAMAAGAANPDIDDAFAAVGDDWYDTIVCPWTDGATITALDAFVEAQMAPLVQKSAMAYVAYSASHSTLVTTGDGLNKRTISAIGAYKSATPPWEWAAAYAGQIALWGGEDPARPFLGLDLTGVLAPAREYRFSAEERDLLLHHGIATWTVEAGGDVQIERAITSFRLNDLGYADTSYLNVNTLLTLFYLRWSLAAIITQKYLIQRFKWDRTDGPVPPGQKILNPSTLRDELIAIARQWQQAGLIVDLDQFIADVLVEGHATEVDFAAAIVPPTLIAQFRGLAANIEFRL